MDQMNEPMPVVPLQALPIERGPLTVLPLEDAATHASPLQINYADAALRKRMSRLSAASCIVAVCAIPTTVGAALFVDHYVPEWAEIAAWTTFLSTHLTCLTLGLWANSLIKQLKGRVADVVMAGIGIALGSACLSLTLLFILGLFIIRAW